MTKSSTPRLRAAFAAMLLAGTTLGGVAFWHGDSVQAQTRAQAAIAPPATTQAALPGFADLVARVRKSVVTITTTERAAMRESESPFPPGGPRDKMFRRYFGDGDTARGPVHALGSGFIVDAEGHVVTNNHVVQGASAVKVTLDDGRELNARVVGRDPRTDVALLKVDAGEPLPYLELGDSDRARPGDWVVAVGNPFGLGGTVTAGIISARGRDIQAGPYDDFLQLDAPINQGNSGGPSFNMEGEVIGVNTAIFSPTGGSIGIGFAIPSNLARAIVADLARSGRIERAWLGINVQDVTPEIATQLGLAAGVEGVLIAAVDTDSPAARGGLRQGDVIVAVNGKRIDQVRDVPRSIAALKPGTRVTLTVLRRGREVDVPVTTGRLPN